MFEDPTDNNTAKPAGLYPWGGDLPTTQATFAALFLGYSTQRYDSTRAVTLFSQQVGVQDGLIRIGTSGICLYDCAIGSTFNVGDFVGPAKDPNGQALLPQTVAAAVKAGAIGRIERAVVNASRVYVRILTAKLGPLTN